MEWKGYDLSQNRWVHRDALTNDVPEIFQAFDAQPSTFNARTTAPKRATNG